MGREAIYYLKIHWALHLFYSSAWHAVSINHSSSDIAVTKKRLYCADVIVGLQEVRGKNLPESVGGHVS